MGRVESSASTGCWVRSNKPEKEKSTFFFVFLCPSYHCSKQCLAGCCLKRNLTVLSDFQTSHGSVASRAWEQTLSPDAVPVCSWMDIKVPATRQAGLFTGAGQPCNLITAVMDTLIWTAYYGSTLKERLCQEMYACVLIPINSTCMNKSSSWQP